jgi:peptide/nickel transport system permease protein
LSVVVIFAYILGFTVLVLDITYIAVDPRVRVNSDGQINTSTTPKFAWLRYIKRDRSRKHPGAKKVTFSSVLFAMRNIRVKLCGIKAGLQRTMCEILHYPSAITGLVLISFLIIGSLYAVIAYPYFELGEEWHRTSLTGRFYIPKNVPAEWINLFRKKDYPTTILLRSRDGGLTKTTNHLKNGKKEILFSAPISYPFGDFPQDIILYIDTDYQEKAPHISISWITPDGREIHPKSPAIKSSSTYFFSEYIVLRSFLRNNKNWEKWFVTKGPKPTPPIYALFASPEADEPTAIPGTYQLKISALTFEDDTNVSIEFVLLGQVYGKAGTDYMRRDLLIPLLWGLPFALVFGLIGAVVTTLFAMTLAATGVWLGGGVDGLIQRLTEVNMILPILAIGVLIYYLYDVSLWVVMTIIISLNVFGAPTRAFRAAFLQEKQASYIEAARAYGASNIRIILIYMIPRIIPTLIPQLVALIPSLVFLEATLSILGVYDPRFPTWGRVIYDALEQKALWGGSYYWVLEPITLLLLTGLAFALLGFALERILNPRLQEM